MDTWMEEFNLKCKTFQERFSVFVCKHCYFSGAYYLLDILSTAEFPRNEKEVY